MGKEFLVDTNILIYVLANFFPPDKEELKHILDRSLNISIISKVELLSYNKLSEPESQKVHDFLAEANIYFIDEEIAQRTIYVRKKVWS